MRHRSKPQLRNPYSPSSHHWCSLVLSVPDWKVPWEKHPGIAPPEEEKEECVQQLLCASTQECRDFAVSHTRTGYTCTITSLSVHSLEAQVFETQSISSIWKDKEAQLASPGRPHQPQATQLGKEGAAPVETLCQQRKECNISKEDVRGSARGNMTLWPSAYSTHLGVGRPRFHSSLQEQLLYFYIKKLLVLDALRLSWWGCWTQISHIPGKYQWAKKQSVI